MNVRTAYATIRQSSESNSKMGEGGGVRGKARDEAAAGYNSGGKGEGEGGSD